MGKFVFGYGSLAAELQVTPTRAFRSEGFIAELMGYVRGWGVAMDNRLDLPGYKCYTASDGSRPAVFVSFLDVSPGEGATNGLCLPVDAAVLAALDRRERNYARVDVTDRVDVPAGARVWTYVGRPEARARFDGARAAGTAVIAADYVRAVRAAFTTLGAAELAVCAPSLEPGDLPVVNLTRHELA
jgi:gamma-glutamylcyclotransferase (GGCT)/AIG2-like uncharacterized protein YtfP